MPAQTITQGQSFTDTGGRSGVAQFDPNTGAKLSTGQSVTVNPVANTSPTTSTGQAPVQAKPAPAVISSAPAQGFINNIATPAFNNLQQGIQNQAVANGYNDTTHLLPGETLDAYNVRVASVNKTKAATPAPVAPAPTQQDAAATKIANTPDVGNKYVYDPTGQRHEIALAGPVPAGYSTTAPANPTLNGHAPIGQVVNAGNGQMYQAYSDGTFGLLGPDGKFSYGVSAAEFNNAQQTDPKNVLADLQSKIANLSTATIPLQPWQQNGLTALSNSVASVIASEQQANTNYTGAMTDLVNLQGTGNSAVGIGLIKSTIDSGLAKISKLQSDNDLAVSKMEQAFREENYKQIFDSYTAQANIEKDISAEITTMHQFALKTQEDADAQAENVRNFNYKVSQDSVTNLREDALAKSTISRNSSDIQKNKAEIAKIYSDITTANKNSNLTLGLPGGVVPIASDGKADPVYQKQFLDNLAKNNPGLAGTVKGYAEYRFPMGANTFKSKEGQQLLSLIAQYNPAFDSDNYTSRQAVVKSFASGYSGV